MVTDKYSWIALTNLFQINNHTEVNYTFCILFGVTLKYMNNVYIWRTCIPKVYCHLSFGLLLSLKNGTSLSMIKVVTLQILLSFAVYLFLMHFVFHLFTWMLVNTCLFLILSSVFHDFGLGFDYWAGLFA